MQLSEIFQTPTDFPCQLELTLTPRRWGYLSPSREEIQPLVVITEFLLRQNFEFCQATTGDGVNEITHTGVASYDTKYTNFQHFKNCFVSDFYDAQKQEREDSGGWISSLDYSYVDVHLQKNRLYLRAIVKSGRIVMQWLDIEYQDQELIQHLCDELFRLFSDPAEIACDISTDFPIPKKCIKPHQITPNRPKSFSSEPVAAVISQPPEEEDEIVIGPYVSPTEGPCGKNLRWALTEDHTLVISGNGPMGSPYITQTRYITKELESFEHVFGNWLLKAGDQDSYYELPWDHAERIQKIQIQSGVTSVAAGVFSTFPFAVNEHVYHGNYEALTQIILPNTMTILEHNAIANCPKLETVVVPASVTQIGQGVFDHCPKLTVYTTSGSYAERYAREKGIRLWLLDAPASAESAEEEEPDVAWFPPHISFHTSVLHEAWQEEAAYLQENGELLQGKLILSVADYSFYPRKSSVKPDVRMKLDHKTATPMQLCDGILTVHVPDRVLHFSIAEDKQASLQAWLDEKLSILATIATFPPVFLAGSDQQICQLHPFLKNHSRDSRQFLQLLREQFPVFKDTIPWYTSTVSITTREDQIQFTTTVNTSGREWKWDESSEHLMISMHILEIGFFDDSEYEYHFSFTIRYLGSTCPPGAEELLDDARKIDLEPILQYRRRSQAAWVAENPHGLEGFYHISWNTD